MKDDKKQRILPFPSQEGFANMIGMIPTDPLGSYTGRPADIDDEPVQDADDL